MKEAPKWGHRFYFFVFVAIIALVNHVFVDPHKLVKSTKKKKLLKSKKKEESICIGYWQ